MHFFRHFLLIFVFFIQFFPLNALVLDEVKDRGYLICGVAEPRSGFANIDNNSNGIFDNGDGFDWSQSEGFNWVSDAETYAEWGYVDYNITFDSFNKNNFILINFVNMYN